MHVLWKLNKTEMHKRYILVYEEDQHSSDKGMQSGSPARVQLNDVDIGMVVRGGFIVLDVPADVHTLSTDMCKWRAAAPGSICSNPGGNIFSISSSGLTP